MGKSILIIDDDSYVRNSLKQVLEFHGYKVYEARNGKEGIEAYRRINTDIVLTDIYMPDKDGLETLREIKKEFPDAKIIVMSGFYQSNMDFFEVARSLGAIVCINKPFTADDIIEVVDSTLEGKAACS